MRRNTVWLIFKKEFVDLLRDRKTWIGAFIIPIVVVPLVFILLSSSMSSVEREARAYIPFAVQGDSQNPIIQQLLQVSGTKLLTPDDPMQALKQGDLRAIVEIPANFEQKLNAFQPLEIKVWYDPSNQKSSYAQGLIEETVNNYQQSVVVMRLQAVGLDASVLHPLALTKESVASDEKLTGSMLASIIPLMLVLSLASGGMPAATDLVAGEKERGTLESLISAPISSGSILTAKLLAVMLMSGVSAVASLISLSIVFSFAPLGVSGASFSLSFLHPLAFVLLLFMLLLLSATFAGVELAISTFAKSFKEAQTYMTPVIFLAMVPAYMLLPLNPLDIPFFYYILPIFNGLAIFKEIFYGDLHLIHTLAAVISSIVYVVIVIAIAANFFRRERLVVK